MADQKLFSAKLHAVPFSSVVGSSLTLQIDGLGCVAMLMISVPQVHFDYQQVSEAVAEAIIRQTKGVVTLVLPEEFGDRARQELAKARGKKV